MNGDADEWEEVPIAGGDGDLEVADGEVVGEGVDAGNEIVCTD